MNKKLFLLPLSALLLVACGGAKAKPFVMDINSCAGFADLGEETYFAEAGQFEFAGVNWAYGANGFGRVSSKYADNAGLLQLNCLQFKKGNLINNVEPLGAGYTDIVIEWYATYATEDTKYFPTVKAGVAADALEVVAANETQTATGEDTGVMSGTKKVYKYVSTYTLTNLECTYFAVGASANAALNPAKINFNVTK